MQILNRRTPSCWDLSVLPFPVTFPTAFVGNLKVLFISNKLYWQMNLYVVSRFHMPPLKNRSLIPKNGTGRIHSGLDSQHVQYDGVLMGIYTVCCCCVGYVWENGEDRPKWTNRRRAHGTSCKQTSLHAVEGKNQLYVYPRLPNRRHQGIPQLLSLPAVSCTSSIMPLCSNGDLQRLDQLCRYCGEN